MISKSVFWHILCLFVLAITNTYANTSKTLRYSPKEDALILLVDSSTVRVCDSPSSIGLFFNFNQMKYDISRKIKSGIYIIRNSIDSRIYIGSSKDLHGRYLDHNQTLLTNKHPNPHLQHFCNKHGIDKLVFELLEYCTFKNLLPKEQIYLDSYKPFSPFGFNIARYARGGFNKHSEESKLKMSLQRKGVKRKPLSSAHKKALSKSHKNSKPAIRHLKKLHIYLQKTYTFLNPNGKLVTIKNLKRFCIKNNLSNTKMVSVNKGRTLSHRGWKNPNGRDRKLPSHFRTVYQFSLTGEFIDEYSSILKACTAMNTTNVLHLAQCANNKRHSFKGYVWSFVPSFPTRNKIKFPIKKFNFSIGDLVYVISKDTFGIIDGFTKTNLIQVEIGISTSFCPTNLIKL